MAMSPGFGLKLVTAPTFEPVSVADMVAHSRIFPADVDSGLVGAQITAAREYVEVRCKRQIPQAQYLLTLDQFPGRQVDDYRPPTWRYGIIRMPLPPLISVDLIQYIDPGQSAPPFTLTTLATTKYQVDANTEPGRVAPAPFEVWPATNPLAMAAIQITFTCGWPDIPSVPARAKQAIKFIAAHLYENRELGIEGALTLIPGGLAAFCASVSTGEYV